MNGIVNTGIIAAAGISIAAAGATWNDWTEAELFATPEVRSDAGFERYRVHGTESFLIEGLPTSDGRKSFAYGYLARPEGTPPAGGWPAVVLFHGGGGTAFAEYAKAWSRRGYVAITVDHYGQLPDTSVRRPGRPVLPCSWQGMAPRPFVTEQSENNDTEMRRLWVRNAVGLLAHVHTYLLGLPYVDKTKTGLLGISWGSVMGSILCSLDKRFAFAVFCYGCGCFDRGEDAGSFLKFEDEPWEPKNYLGNLETPCHWIIGTNDMAFELPCWQKSADSAPGTRGRTIATDIDHAHTGWLYDMTFRFADSMTGCDSKPPKLGGNVRNGDMVQAKILDPGDGIRRVELRYTLEAKSSRARRWMTAPAEVADGCVRARLPLGTRAFFLNAYDRTDPKEWKWPEDSKAHLTQYDTTYDGGWLWPASSPYSNIE
ncbi:MAG: hypothetical protein MJ025_00635 [Victivallaceae bacterium]|nr:hypothetical protein [Victivallaceae bacterium]